MELARVAFPCRWQRWRRQGRTFLRSFARFQPIEQCVLRTTQQVSEHGERTRRRLRVCVLLARSAAPRRTATSAACLPKVGRGPAGWSGGHLIVAAAMAAAVLARGRRQGSHSGGDTCQVGERGKCERALSGRPAGQPAGHHWRRTLSLAPTARSRAATSVRASNASPSATTSCQRRRPSAGCSLYALHDKEINHAAYKAQWCRGWQIGESLSDAQWERGGERALRVAKAA